MEITKTNEIINKVLAIKPKYFTPPYGALDTKVIEVAAQVNMVTILSSLDTLRLED